LKSRLRGNAGLDRDRVGSWKVGLKVMQVLKRSGSGAGK
jgi:hypothetical protein